MVTVTVASQLLDWACLHTLPTCITKYFLELGTTHQQSKILDSKVTPGHLRSISYGSRSPSDALKAASIHLQQMPDLWVILKYGYY
jgi:hypothetical protein